MTVSTAIDASAVARVLGIQTQFKDLRGGSVVFLPQRIALVGQGASASTYSTTKLQVTSAYQVGSVYGFGSPLHLAAKQLFPINGDGVGTVPVTIYPLEDHASGVVGSGDITPAGTPTAAASYIVRAGGVNSLPFVISVGDTVATRIDNMVAAINGVLDMPIIAADGTTELTFTTKWAGVSANSVVIEVIGDTTVGNTFAISQTSGGLVNPDVSTALDQVGDVWETIIANCLDIADTTTLGLYAAFGEGRWGAITRKPLVVITGSTASSVASATAVSDARKTDRVNVQAVLPGSAELPLSVMARTVARVAVRANNNPPRDYAGLRLDGLVPGTDGSQWMYTQRDQAIKAGSSTVEVRDGVPVISDLVTFYHPSGDPTPAYRYVVDIVRIQNIIFNVALEFEGDDWAGAPLIPDGQPTVNPAARTPRAAVAAVSAILDSLGLNALISDPETAKAGTVAEINASNPKRLDVRVPVQLSGNTGIISTDLDFGFYFG